MPKVTIQQPSLLSLPALNHLFVKAVLKQFTYFPENVRKEVIKEHSTWKLFLGVIDPRRVILVARVDGEIIGYAIGAAPSSGPAQLFWLYVEPDHRGANIGLSLLSRMLKVLAAKGAKVISIATFDHRRYYERQGFEFIKKADVEGVKMDVMVFKVKP
jgi:GNAT superfamily N-acetyltransferase